jgi:twitching motility protein PilT
MKTLDQALLELLKKGLISREVAREKAKNPQGF